MSIGSLSINPLLDRIRSDKGLSLEMSAFKSLYGGQFTLSTQLIIPNYLGLTCLTFCSPFQFLKNLNLDNERAHL